MSFLGCFGGGATSLPQPPSNPQMVVSPGDTIVFDGDSITAFGWMNPAVNAIDALWGVGAVNYVVSAVPGNKAADLAANVPGRITNHNPTHVVILIGVNDVTTPTALSSFRTSIQTILGTVRAWSSTVQIAVLTIFNVSEHWTMLDGSPVWNNNPYDGRPAAPTYTPALPEYNWILQVEAGRVGATWVDVRSAYLQYESVNNTPPPGSNAGILTSDGVHPNAAGQQLASDTWMNHVTLVP